MLAQQWWRKKILEINILFLLIKNKFKPHFANVENCLDSTNTLHFLDNALYQPIWRKECVYYHLKYHCISNFEKYIDLVCGEQKVAYLYNVPKLLFNRFVDTFDLNLLVVYFRKNEMWWLPDYYRLKKKNILCFIYIL